MHHRRRVALPLILLALVASLLVLAGPATLFNPTNAYQFMPDLAINAYVDPGETDPFAPGNEITYGIYATNQGSTVANDVRVTVTLPEHTTYVSSSGPGFILIQAGPDQVVWVRDRLTSWEQGWLSVTVRVDDDAPVGAIIENSVYILCLDLESDYSNNDSSIHGSIRPAEPDPRVTKHLWQNSSPIAAGNEIVYEIVPENWSGSAANSVRITDTLPADCTYVSDNTADSGFTTVQTGTLVVWSKASMAPELEQPGAGFVGNLYVHCQIAKDWTPDQWLESAVEISTTDAEYNYDNNLVRWTYKPEEDWRYGVAVTSLDDGTMRLLSNVGFDYVLYYLDWSRAEPSDDDHYLDELNAAVWQAWRYNLRLVVRVDRAPAWAQGPGSASAPPSDPGKLGEFLQVVAVRWPRQPGNPEQAQIYGYVIWNEPNLAAEWGENAPDAAAYTSLLQAAYNGVKAASPDAWVISAGLATTDDDPPNAVDDRAFLQSMYAAGAGSYFDYLGANPMGFASAPDDTTDANGYNFRRAEAWRTIMEANGDGAKDMFGTEIGWLRTTSIDLGSGYNWMKVSEIDQAHYLVRAYHKAACDWTRTDGTSWLGPMMTWNLDFAAGDYSDTEHPYWFSITDENRVPLRSYLTLRNAANHGPADLWLEKELVDPVEPGQDVRYVIRYTNIGGQVASGVVMTDTLPLGAEYVCDTGGGMPTPVGDQVVWNLGDVVTCTYETITLTLHLSETPPPNGELINQVEANTLPGEPYTDDNVATVVTPIPGLGIYKAVTPAVAAPGQTVTYTLTFGNTGQDTVSSVFITDVVPVTLTNISYAHSGAVVTPSGNVSYTWQAQDLEAEEGGIITITGVIHPDVSGTFSLTNRATITTTSADPFWQDNVSVVSSTVDAEPPVPPALVSPADDAVTNSITPTLTWNASLSPDAAGYLLDFEGVVQDVGDVPQRTTSILADGTYTWTVAAYDAAGNTSAYTDTWSFTVALYRLYLPLVMAGPAGTPDF
jgi:uncharacterized repeat protein (TIGR01451 family)